MKVLGVILCLLIIAVAWGSYESGEITRNTGGPIMLAAAVMMVLILVGRKRRQ